MSIIVFKDKEYYKPEDSILSLRNDIDIKRNMLDDPDLGTTYRADIYDYIKLLESLAG